VPVLSGQAELKEVTTLLARGYLRLLAQRVTGVSGSGNPAKPVDSRRPKSVNELDQTGGRDA
jgi:hypothetical protein